VSPLFTIATFRASFPEFADIAVYPDVMITLWSTFATAQVNCNRWGDQTLMGVSLYTAHELVLAAQNQKAGVIGGTPGQQAGPANSKTVGTVTASYDASTTTEKDAGYWNLTTYGKQFIRLARIFGSGAVQL
jgi:Protein of unknown function (DUF4054)